jgi:hypothetical protein
MMNKSTSKISLCGVCQLYRKLRERKVQETSLNS